MNFTRPGCAHRNGSGFIQCGMEINPYGSPKNEFDAKPEEKTDVLFCEMFLLVMRTRASARAL
jgi:hypothetical protein